MAPEPSFRTTTFQVVSLAGNDLATIELVPSLLSEPPDKIFFPVGQLTFAETALPAGMVNGPAVTIW